MSTRSGTVQIFLHTWLCKYIGLSVFLCYCYVSYISLCKAQRKIENCAFVLADYIICYEILYNMPYHFL